MFLRENQRAILSNWERDTAAVVFPRGSLGLPKVELPLISPEKNVRVGVELGWLGFPGLVVDGPCFFSGRVSLYREKLEEYFVDGVAIPGVSGSPAFHIRLDNVRLVGVLSAYIPNRLTGESLPGLSVVKDVSSLRTQIEQIRSLGAAKEREAEQSQEGDQSQPQPGPQPPRPGRRHKKK